MNETKNPIHRDDLPTDPTDIEQDGVDFIDGLGVDEAADLIIVLGQLDPVEVANGQPRWTDEQRALIIRAKDKFNSWSE